MNEEKQKYYLFPKYLTQWQLILCTSPGKSEMAKDDQIAKTIALTGKDEDFKPFEPANYVCINHGTDIDEYMENCVLYEIWKNGQREIWEIGDCVFDMDQFLIPNVYYVRHIGIIIP